MPKENSDVKEPVVALGASSPPAPADTSSDTAPQEKSPVRFGSFDTPLPDTPSPVWDELEKKKEPTRAAGEPETEETEEVEADGATPEAEADTETQAEEVEPTMTEVKEAKKARTKLAFDRLREADNKKLADKETEITTLRAQLARNAPKPAVSDVPPELLQKYNGEYTAYQRKQTEGTATQEDWQRLDNMRLEIRDKQHEANVIRKVTEQRHQEHLNQVFREKLLGYHQFSPILKQSEQGPQLDFASPLMLKAQQIAARDGLDLGTNLFLCLAEAKADLATVQQTRSQREVVRARAATGLEGAGTPPPSAANAQGAEQRRLQKLSDEGDPDATRQLMELAYARRKRK